MPETLPRWLLVLTAIIAVVAIYIGVKDHLQRRSNEANVPSASVPDVQSQATKTAKKTASAKARRARISGVKSSPASTSADPTTGSEKRVADDVAESTPRGTNDADDMSKLVTDAAMRIEGLQSPHDVVKRALTRAECLPLPNLTKPQDVDASYYRNWAREYGCELIEP